MVLALVTSFKFSNPPCPMPDQLATPRRTTKLRRRWVLRVALVLLGALLAGELVARSCFGLGKPLLYQVDSEMEYLPKPNQELRRFGNRIHINRWSQRSEEITQYKTDPNELRVLLIGDSIVFGGSQSDQSETCGSYLEALLRQGTRRPVRVLSVAAGSWGPANQTAYLQRFGIFDADAAIWLLSTGDWFDAPTFTPIVGVDPSYPARRPVLALGELVSRYIWPRLIGAPAASNDDQSRNSTVLQTAPFAAGLKLLHSRGIEVTTWHWPSKDAVAGNFDSEALAQFQAVSRDNDAPFADLLDVMRSLRTRDELYRDHIHPSVTGNRWIAEQLSAQVLRDVEK